MQQQVDVAPEPVDLGADGVDEERHVVVHDLDDGVLERPASFLGGWIEEPDVWFPRLPHFAEFPERERAAEECVEGGVDDVVGCDEGEIAPHELRCALGLVGADAVSRLGRKTLHEVDFSVFGGDSHREAVILSWAFPARSAAACRRLEG